MNYSTTLLNYKNYPMKEYKKISLATKPKNEEKSQECLLSDFFKPKAEGFHSRYRKVLNKKIKTLEVKRLQKEQAKQLKEQTRKERELKRQLEDQENQLEETGSKSMFHNPLSEQNNGPKRTILSILKHG